MLLQGFLKSMNYSHTSNYCVHKTWWQIIFLLIWIGQKNCSSSIGFAHVATPQQKGFLQKWSISSSCGLTNAFLVISLFVFTKNCNCKIHFGKFSNVFFNTKNWTKTKKNIEMILKLAYFSMSKFMML